MIDNVFVINTQEQIRALSSDIKLRIVNALIKNPATCQQLADIFGLSKQKIHYNLKNLIAEKLIQIDITAGNDKEKYYRASARNYVIDFSLGKNVSETNTPLHRPLINSILEETHNINLNRIAANILDNSLKLKPREKLLIVSGDYNLPLVEQIIIEASKRQVFTTLLYRNKAILQAKHDTLSLAAYQWDFEMFNRVLKDHNVYLYLNGESRFIPLTDPGKIPLHRAAQGKSLEIINQKKIRVAMMPGLISNSLDEQAIVSEVHFWKALDIDFDILRQETDRVIQSLLHCSEVQVTNAAHSSFTFVPEHILGEYGAFTDSPHQSPVINLPGGEVLIVPREKSFSGVIHADAAYIDGKKLPESRLEITNNRITRFEAGEHTHLIEAAIQKGGADGDRIALICIGTNYRMNNQDSDLASINKSNGMLTIYWGNNQPFGGSVEGKLEWSVQLMHPTLHKQ
jgi:leucyl aminopeptidase (aminopeptidase T)